MQLTERVSCIFDPADKALLLSEQAADAVLDLPQNAILKPQNNFVDKIMSLMRYSSAETRERN